MMLDNHDERVQYGLRILSEALGEFVTNYAVFDQSLLDRIEEIVNHHAASFKTAHGYEFPPLGIFVLPSARFVICARKDLDSQEIRAQLLVWLRQFADKGIHPSALEVAIAVRKCWPGYRPPLEEFRKDKRKKLVLH